MSKRYKVISGILNFIEEKLNQLKIYDKENEQRPPTN